MSELHPAPTAIDCEKESELCAGEKQIRINVILHHRPDNVPVREISGD